MKILANNLKSLRKEKGLSRKQLSEQAGVPLYMITACENEKKYLGYRRLENLCMLADFFGVTTDLLLMGAESSKNSKS